MLNISRCHLYDLFFHQISLILHGELGISETRELIRDDGHALFERCSRDRFLLTLGCFHMLLCTCNGICLLFNTILFLVFFPC